MEEPLVLGGAEAPMIAEPVAPRATMHAEAKPMVASSTKRFLGLFGRRRAEPEQQYQVEPRMEAAAPVHPSVSRQPVASAPAPTVAQPQQAPAPTARVAEPKQQAPAPDDLFAGVSEDDRFEIPAFLRRQANSGG
jgi:cell division protein FtsZ